jgi:hypothetical protein
MSFYIAGMVCVKCSILMLYKRIFQSERPQKVLIALAVFIISWALTALFCGIFLCYSIELNWDPTVKGRCIDYGKVTIVIGILNIFADFAILVFPLPIVWRLHISTRRKYLLTWTFSAGFWYVKSGSQLEKD